MKNIAVISCLCSISLLFPAFTGFVSGKIGLLQCACRQSSDWRISVLRVCNSPNVAVWLLAALFYFSSSPLPIGLKNAFSSLLRKRTRYGAGTTEVRRRYDWGHFWSILQIGRFCGLFWKIDFIISLCFPSLYDVRLGRWFIREIFCSCGERINRMVLFLVP